MSKNISKNNGKGKGKNKNSMNNIEDLIKGELSELYQKIITLSSLSHCQYKRNNTMTTICEDAVIKNPRMSNKIFGFNFKHDIYCSDVREMIDKQIQYYIDELVRGLNQHHIPIKNIDIEYGEGNDAVKINFNTNDIAE